jgi:queuine tRNA-ribosyltransferase
MKVLATPHGELPLPAFLPDATRGVVKAVDSEDLERAGVAGLMVNILHLSTQPGLVAITQAGGIHAFMNWARPVASDSGGFQIYSLLAGAPQRGRISEEGFTYRLPGQAEKEKLTPEKCIRKQFAAGSDILFCLDYCTHPRMDRDTQKESVELTVSWSRRCKAEFERCLEQRPPNGPRPILMAIAQGGGDLDLRRRCVEQLLEIGFDGYAYGGWPIQDGEMVDAVGWVAQWTPNDKPRFALGIGKPNNVARAVKLGYDLFDCVLPTRDARHKRLYVAPSAAGSVAAAGEEAGAYATLNLDNERHRGDPQPPDPTCDCLCCRRYSRGYLRHLFQVGDVSALRLATIHNLRFYARLMEALQAQKAL